MQTNSQKRLNNINTNNHTINRALSSDHEYVQCAYVRGGHLKSNYEDWVQNSKPCVRKLIAENYPEYITLLPCETDWELDKVKTYLLDYFKPKLDVLEKFLAKVGPVQKHNTEVIALQLKHETLTRDMTAIEKTMNLQQLWESNSPFWTEKLSGNEIVDVLSAYSWSNKLRNEFDFEKAYNNANNPFNQRLMRARPYLNIDEELLNILNEEPKCSKILTPLIC